MMDGFRKNGERAELGELRGFGEADNILDAFRDVEVMAEATKADNALFHVQVRLPDHERVTPEQWQHTADRIENRLGLTGQPRAVYFHINDKTGERHMHIGFSLVEAETMTVKPLPYFKFRLKNLARQLEEEFDLTRVPNHREGPIKFAATKAQQEQDRRLGVNGDEIRNAIRACWERADCGRSFDDALADEALILVQGTRRDYLVMDHAGGLHALGKRILDVSATKVRDRLSDLDRANLPTIEQAREFMLDLPRDYEDRLKRELAEVQKQIDAEREYARRDPVRDQMAWEDALAKAAIAKEEKDREFVAPKDREKEKEAAAFQRATADARAGGQQGKEQGAQREPPAPELGNLQGQIRLARSLSHGPQGFANALEDRGFILARVTPDDIRREMEQLQKEWEKHRRDPQTWMEYEGGFAVLPPDHQASTRRSFDEWKKQREQEKKKASSLEDYVLYVQGKWSEGPKSQLERAAGGLAVVTSFGSIYTLTPRNTGLQREELPEYLKGIDRAPLLSVTDAQTVMQDVRDQRGIEWEIEQHRRRKEWEKGRGQRSEEWEKEQARTERPLSETLAGIRLAYSLSQSPDGLIKNLDEIGFKLARATKIEADRSHRNAAYAHEIGRYAPEYREGEYVAINERGRVVSLNRRTAGESREDIAAFMRTADHTKIQGIEDTRQQIAAYKRPAPARELFPTAPHVTGGIPMQEHAEPLTAWQQFGKASWETTQRDRAPDEMRGPVADIWTAYKRSDSARAFVAALQERNIEIGLVTREDITSSEIHRFYAADLNTPRNAIPPKLREGDYVAITDDARIYNLNTRTTGDSAERVQKFMATLDRKEFQGVGAVLKTVQERAELRDIERQAFRDLSAGEMKRAKDPRPAGRLPRTALTGKSAAGNIKGGLHKSVAALEKVGGLAASMGKAFDVVGGMLESLAAPKLTPEQIRDGEKAKDRREAAAEDTIDFSRHTAETAQHRRQVEQEREAERQRQRDGGGRER
jgi:hypothetical protein